MDAEILWRELPASDKEIFITSFSCRDASNQHGRVVIWLALMLLMTSIPMTTVWGACDGCIAPVFTEWRYRAASCSSFIPPEGESYNEAGIVEQVQDAINNCNQFSGFDDTGWPATGQYFGGICGGGTNVPKYGMGIEDFNKRAITSECGGYNIDRKRNVGCPGNTIRHYDNSVPYYYNLCKAEDDVASGDKNLGSMPFCSNGPAGNPLFTGNPINVAYANKLQVETDLVPMPVSGLGITRFYNSKDNSVNKSYRFGTGWRSGHDRSLIYTTQPPQGGITTDTVTVFLYRPDGKVYYFTRTTGPWVTDTDTPGSVIETATGWQYTTASDAIEEYDSTGKLIRITTVSGVISDYTYYPSNYVETVTSSRGESLTYTYDMDDRIDTITDHTDRVWMYRYDANNNLEYVIYPEGTPLDDTDNPVRQYHYEDVNFPNLLTGITDERGIRYAHFEYDASARPIASYHGPQTSVLTDRIEGVSIGYSGSTRTVTNSMGLDSTYTTATRIGVALVTDITGPGCTTCGTGNSSYNYDPLTNDLLSRTENGVTTEYGNYDDNGNPGYMIEARGTTEERRTDYTYNPNYYSRLDSITEPSVYSGATKVTAFTYDGFGNRTSGTISGFDPNGNPVVRTTTWQYNGPLNQLSQIDGPRTNVSDITTFRYYLDSPAEGVNRARLKEIEDATGALDRSNIQYTATGKVASESRPNELSLTYTYYPGNDRLETLTETGGTTNQVSRWTYEATGEVKSITTADGSSDATTITFDYDDARRLVRITDGLGNYIRYILDTEGNREAENIHDSTGTLKKSLTRVFDIYSRLDIASQANEGMDYDYVPDGTLDQQTDGNGTVTDFSYDSLKRLLTSTRDSGGLGAITGYGYDVADNLTSVIDPVNGTTGYSYDDLGNLLQTISPDTGTTVFAYDAAGNLKSRQDALGQLFIYSYDALNRLTGIDAPGTDDDITYGYDNCPKGNGRLCSVIPPDSVLTYAYDAFGNVANHQGVAYSHDAAKRVKIITYPSGAVVTYGYDAAGQVSKVDLIAGGDTTVLASNIDYAPYGPVESLDYGNGASLSQSLDAAYRLTAQSVTGALDLDYTTYDANGNLESQTDTNSGTGNYSYDVLNRLDIATGAFGSRDYDYDLNGNRTSLVSDAVTTTYGYTASSNRLATESGWSYVLDANGNTTDRLRVDGAGEGRSFSYTSHNRLASVTDHVLMTSGKGKKKTITLEDQLVSNYAYNGLGQRVSKTIAGGDETRFLFGTDGALLAETDNVGTVKREYVYLNTQLLAVLDPAATQGSGGDEIITDNGSVPIGWVSKTSNKDYGPDYLYSTGGTGNQVRWSTLLTAGTYEVYARWISNRKYSKSVPYTITHDGQTDMVAMDQSRNGGSWQLLGTYAFNGSGNEYVEVSDATGKTTADAVRFVKQGGEPGNTTTVYYVHNDHLGTPQVMTDENGSTAWRASYDPFGSENIDASSTTKLNVRFPGQYFDKETGLHYNYFRTYDPRTGRYITADPIGIVPPPGITPYKLNHLYAYVGNNPLSGIDPLGLFEYYGNWCGPNHTGGFDRPWDQLTPQEQQNALLPQDDLDICCQTHDQCHADCRTNHPCSDTDRQSCFERCDRSLANCAQGCQSGGSRRWLLERYMRNSNPGAGLNAPSCRRTGP